MILSCERCSKQTAKLTKCNYCSKNDCVSCIRSTKKVHKIKHMAICKNCWGVMRNRRQFKNA
ncbi:hypothetical protein J4450_01180 [Candidatus Micrarchaeota archaeon]|nr:hypothetical protein [Candidatus Micrarchaeota archaeon]